MDKIKEFFEKHQKEIIIGFGLIASYQVGYRRGFKYGVKFEDALIGFTKGVSK